MASINIIQVAEFAAGSDTSEPMATAFDGVNETTFDRWLNRGVHFV